MTDLEIKQIEEYLNKKFNTTGFEAVRENLSMILVKYYLIMSLLV